MAEDYVEHDKLDEDKQAHLGNGFYLYKDLLDKLYPHQREGVLWFWGLHKKNTGGILGDDMGLGKTIQVIAFLSGLFNAQQARSVMIVMPVSLIENWKREFGKWAPGLQVLCYHGGSLRDRQQNAIKVQKGGGVLLTSYGMIVSCAQLLANEDVNESGSEFKWDYVILDEGHKIKNRTKTSTGVHRIAARNRIILTGTPVQNNLHEMWSLFNWTHHGMLLGTSCAFKSEYENPITRAREKCATFSQRRFGEKMAESLKQIIAPYFLRRTKQEIKDKGKTELTSDMQLDGPQMPELTRKNDFVVWVYLSELQQKIYKSFIEQDNIKELLNSSRMPLTAISVLKKICDHPRLLSNSACHRLGLFTPQELGEADETTMKDCAANRIHSVDDAILIQESGKLTLLVQLMAQLKNEGHRTLIFSASRKMLDIIQKVLSNHGHMIMRMDGTVTDLSEREKCVSSFQNESSEYDTFLLTTQVGGVGLTLTAADRVVIFDPSWNPATDSQAVDRAFRIGQNKNVVIYRFISCGTVEEKIYRRQVFKDSITRQTMTKDKNPFRYFTNTDLHDLFMLDDPTMSKTQQQLEQMHINQRKTDTNLNNHIEFLNSCEMFGISDHDLMFSQEEIEEERSAELKDGHTAESVSKVQELISKESELQSCTDQEEPWYMPLGLSHFEDLAMQVAAAVEKDVDEEESNTTSQMAEYSSGDDDVIFLYESNADTVRSATKEESNTTSQTAKYSTDGDDDDDDDVIFLYESSIGPEMSHRALLKRYTDSMFREEEPIPKRAESWNAK